MMKKNDKRSILMNIWESRYLYLLILPAFVWLLIFCYGPMYGVLMAVVDYKPRFGIFGSEFVGLKHFKRIFITANSF